MNKKVNFIINPMSASGKTKQRWPLISPKIRSKFPHAEFMFTQTSGEAESLTQKAIEQGANMVVAVGGDGTMNEVVNGYLKMKHLIDREVSIGLLAMGTGSDLCRSLGIPRNLDSALDLLLQDPIKVDCGQVTIGEDSRFFDNIASVGISGDIAKRFEKDGKDGVFSYVTGLFKSARAYQKRGFSIEFKAADGSWKQRELPDAFLALIANAAYFGGGMNIAPKAKLNDGLFHCVLVRGVSGLEILRYLPSIFRGKHIQHEPFSDFEASEVRIKVTEPSWLEVDGEPCFEILPGQSLEFNLHRHSLNLHMSKASQALIKNLD